MTRYGLLAAIVLSTLTTTAAHGQDLAPSLTILEPAARSYLVGLVRLRAAVTPEDEVEAVEFFVDGARVCTVTTPPFHCSWDAGSSVQAHVVRAVARLDAGRRQVASVRTLTLEGIQETTGVRAVLVPVVVRDANNRFVMDLTRDDFRVFEDGVRQEVTTLQTHAEIDSIPLNLVVAVDISGSMAPLFDQVRTALKQFMIGMTGAAVSFIAFNERIFNPVHNERDVRIVQDMVDALPEPYGNTSMLDAIDVAIELHGDILFRKAVILVSDGADTSSLTAIDKVERKLQANPTTIYIITHGSGREVQAGQQLLARLTQVSGGRAFLIDNVEQLDGFLEYIREDLRNQYVITYRPSNPALDGTWRRIEVRTGDRGHDIRARDGYMAESVY